MRKLAAICISGHLRKYELTYKSLYDSIIQPLIDNGYNVDIFISTWDELDTKICSSFVHGFHEKRYDKIDYNSIKSIFNPISIDIENYESEKHKFALSNFINVNSIPIEDHLWDGSVTYWVPQYYKFMRVNNLKKENEEKNGFIYDLVIKTRFDLIYQKQINFNNIDLSKMFCRDKHHDVFFLSSSQNIDILCDYYNHISEILNERLKDIHPEVNLYYYLDKFKFEYLTDYHFAVIHR
jgi:hypothetical protein